MIALVRICVFTILWHCTLYVPTESRIGDVFQLICIYLTVFCTRGKEVVALDEAINLFAAAAVAVREVFQIDSSVRLTAIEHLG